MLMFSVKKGENIIFTDIRLYLFIGQMLDIIDFNLILILCMLDWHSDILFNNIKNLIRNKYAYE